MVERRPAPDPDIAELLVALKAAAGQRRAHGRGSVAYRQAAETEERLARRIMRLLAR